MLINFKKNFNDFFPGNSTLLINHIDRIISFYSSLYILYSFFNTIYSNSDGGSIYFSTSSSILIVIESTSFHFCTSNFNGGAIFFNCNSGNIGFKKNCAYNCNAGYSTGYRGQFGRIITSSNFNTTSLFLSLNKCGPNSHPALSSLYIRNSTINIYYSNISNCVSDLYSISSFISLNILVKFLTAIDNKSNHYIGLEFEGPPFSQLEFSNFVKNKSPQHWGNIQSYFSLINIYKTIFYNNEGILISEYQNCGSIFVNDCHILHSFTITIGTVHLTNIQYSITDTYLLEHINTYYCEGKKNKLLTKNLIKKKILIFYSTLLII